MEDYKLKLKIDKLRIELMMNIVQHKIFREQNISNGCKKKIGRYQHLLKNLKKQYLLISKSR